MSYLLLKPAAKYQASAARFKQAGLDAVSLALIDTHQDDNVLDNLPACIDRLAAGSLVIVISTTAADLSVKRLQSCPQLAHWQANLNFFAVGPSSGAILAAQQFPVVLPKQTNSEGLLALAQLQQVTNKQVLLLKGQGGRQTLSQVLQQRGAKVTELALYQRRPLARPLASHPWHPQQIHSIIATSGELITAAFKQLDKHWLTSLPWVLVSQRTADIAARYGVTRLSISKDATDTGLIQHVQQLLE